MLRVIPADNDSACTEALRFPYLTDKLAASALNKSYPLFSRIRLVGTMNAEFGATCIPRQVHQRSIRCARCSKAAQWDDIS